MSRLNSTLLIIVCVTGAAQLVHGQQVDVALAQDSELPPCTRLVDPVVPSPLTSTDLIMLRAVELQQGCHPIIGPLPGEPYTVTNTDDSGYGSLRYAIQHANSRPGLDTIVFAIASAPNAEGLYVIQLKTWLPPTTDPVIIDTASQPGYTQKNGPVIVIDGSQIEEDHANP